MKMKNLLDNRDLNTPRLAWKSKGRFPTNASWACPEVVYLFVLLFLISTHWVFSQTPKELAVQLTAQVSENPYKIRLQWPVTNANTIKIYRKSSSDNSSFLTPIANLSGSSAQYEDNNVELGVAYEYRVEKDYSNYKSNGYILSGIRVDTNENRGKLILLVEASMTGPLAQELQTLEADIVGDGWSVIRINVQASESVSGVRNRIVQTYNSAPSEVKAVFIVGHVPVPYSGLIVPDGHPDHRGAWPADGYYGDMNGNWTDTTVNSTTATDPRNHNVPGDGKFDQSVLPSDLELQVGRVDFSDLFDFEESETELLRKYLNKNHAFRNKQFVATPRALIDDNFGGGQNSFSSSAYRSFYTMFSPENVQEKDYFSTMTVESYLWSHGNGPGFYNSVRDVGESRDFANSEVKSVFTTLFGSYLGDWDVKNNIMRAALASGNILTCAWSGLPQWQFHQMALGENIGYCAKNTANAFEYQYSANNSKMVHVALLGDPTLRMHTVAPPKELQIVKDNEVELSWEASTENVLGYHVYARLSDAENFERLTTSAIADTFYSTTNNQVGHHTYMVRAIKLEETPSGSYYNLSQGIFREIQIDENGTSVPVEPDPDPDPEQEPDPEPEPELENGEEVESGKIVLYPNPATEIIHVKSDAEATNIIVSDVSGKLFLTPSNLDIDISVLPTGFYILHFFANRKPVERFFVKQ